MDSKKFCNSTISEFDVKTVGLLCLVVGLVWLVLAFNVDTTVPTGSILEGNWGRVHNIGLMNEKQNHLIIASLTVLVGVVLVVLGRKNDNKRSQSFSPRQQPTIQQPQINGTSPIKSNEEIDFDKAWSFLMSYDETAQAALVNVKDFGEQAISDLKIAYKEYRNVAQLEELSIKIASKYKAQKKEMMEVSRTNDPKLIAQAMGLQIVKSSGVGFSIMKGEKQIRWASNEQDLIKYLKSKLNSESSA